VVQPFVAYLGTHEHDQVDFHAGASETSVVMHLRPDLVRPDRLEANLPEAAGRHIRLGGTVDFGWRSNRFGNGSGTIGDPTHATAGWGKVTFERMVTHTVDCLAEIATE
jgi:creatinine amidohydrolase